ncbi:MAG: sugar phosphate isomerase/epimerase [Clostridia bacterium]|nr:sugar phosphate isomerase/epimerase [Clostridia bacterium]
MFPVGVQVYSVRDVAEKDFYGTLKQIKEMGYDGVEFAGLYGHAPAQVKEWLGELGLAAVSAHVSIDDMLSDPDKLFSDYALIGCKYIAVPYLVESRRPGHEGFEQTVKEIAMLTEKAASHGIQMMYHNHDFEFVKLGDKYGFDILYESVPGLVTEQDTCWVNVGGEDPCKYLVKYAGRAPVVHLKDFVMKDRDVKSGLYELIGIKPTERQADEGDFAFRPVGHGVQDIPAILEAAKKAGSEWIIVEQDRECLGWSSMECIRKSIDYLKQVNK